MDAHTKKGVSLGRAPREASSQEVLQKAKAERAARQLERAQQRAAGVVQRHWRGGAVRRHERERLRREWLQRYGSLVAAQQSGAGSLPAAEIAAGVLPPILLAYLPQGQRARQALVGDGALPPALLEEPAALRGCFALLLRSLGSRDEQSNLLAAAAAADSTAAAALVGQVHRLLLLGAATCNSASGDASGPEVLTATAASRLVALLCDGRQWKWVTDERLEQQAARLEHGLLRWLGAGPLLASAARRVAAALEQEQAASAASGPSSSSTPRAKQLSGVLNSLVLSQLRVWLRLQQLQAEAPPSAGPALAEAEAAAGRQLVLRLLPTPRLLQALPPAIGAGAREATSAAAALAEPATYAALLRATKRCCDSGAGGDQPSTPACFWLLGHLVQLAAGAKQAGGSPGGYLPPSQLLRQPGVAVGLAAAAEQLLAAAAAATLAASPAAAAAALEELWPFAEGGFTVQLLNLLPLPQFCSLYHSLLLLADGMGTADDSSAGAGMGMRLLHALAFGAAPLLLPRLWRWLASKATRGWEVASLRGGIAALPSHLAERLGLFCKVYCHSLMVCDDEEFHERQPLFSLAQQRAVAAAVNTLVFRTQLPAPAAGGAARSRGAAAGPGVQPASAMLARAAPLLHRALYERDTRRPYCPSTLWLEPYQALAAAVAAAPASAGTSSSEQGAANGSSAVEELSTAAVVRVLLQQGEEGGAGAPGAPAGLGAPSRPAAVARILLTAPQCVPFEQRVALFRALIAADKQRTHILEDAVAQLGGVGGGIKRKLNVAFVSEHGHEEAGIDVGGLTNELLEGVVAAGLDQRRGLFASTPEGFAFPNPLAERLGGGLASLHVLGLVLGRALYDGVLLQAPLAPFLVSRLQGRAPLFDELQALDPEVYRSLLQLKHYEGPLEDLALDFTVESEALGVRMSEELVAGGSSIPVTAANRLQVIPPAWLRLFSAGEVNQLLGGGEGGLVDVDDMQAHAQYRRVFGGYSASSATIQHFWKVVRGLVEADRRALLRFATSSSRAPLGGFKHLTPPLTIHKAGCGSPNYRRTASLREKLLYAIRSGAGFELS
eukprot:scaffold4.g4884.t1